MPIRVVVAEDNYLVREAVTRLLESDPDIEVAGVCADFDGLLATVAAESPDVVLTDIRMPPTGTDEGVRAAAELRQSHPQLGVVVLSQFVEPGYFLAAVTFYCYAIVILGGRGHVLGPVVGAVVFWFLFQLIDTALREAIGAGWISDELISTSDVGAVQNALVGIGLMLVIILVPQGIFGRRSELLLDER